MWWSRKATLIPAERICISSIDQIAAALNDFQTLYANPAEGQGATLDGCRIARY
jgi:hypothetical protein